MNQDQSALPAWQIVLFLVLAVIGAILIAFLLAQVDTFQRRSTVPSNGPQINDREATVAASELSTIYLQGEASRTPTPSITPTPTESSSAELIPEATALYDEKNCEPIPESVAVYIVKSGDTLASVATKFGVSEEALRLINCLAHDRLIEGQQLLLPPDSDLISPTLLPCDRPPNWKRYKIAPGDTLSDLARTYGTSVYHILEANCLRNPELDVEDEIFLPDSNQNFARTDPKN